MKISVQEYGELMRNWEEEFPVNTWKVNNVHIWPLIKTIVYFNLFREEKKKRKYSYFSQLFIVPGKGLINIGRFLRAKFFFKSLRLLPTLFLFSGATPYRVIWEDKSFNRFLDPIMDYLQLRGYKSLLLEYQKSKFTSTYKTSRVLNLNFLLPVFEYKEKLEFPSHKTEAAKQINAFFPQLEKKTGLGRDLMEKKIKTRLKSILTWANIYEFIFKKTGAKFTFGLSYYNNAMYGMNFAANKLGITSIDMQHGLQGQLHPAYFFTTVPSGGYNILPKYFWVWENISFKNIEKWSKNTVHKPILGGNPWIEFISEKSISSKKKNNSKKLVLFTLQPLKPFIPNHILEVIKTTSEKYDWYLRLHPRMSDIEIKEINTIITENGLNEKINFDEATRLPLPYILNISDLHISKSSGSIAEAAIMQTPTLIIDELGVESFQDLIDSKQAYSCLSVNCYEIITLIETVIEKEYSYPRETNNLFNYKKIMDSFLDGGSLDIDCS